MQVGNRNKNLQKLFIYHLFEILAAAPLSMPTSHPDLLYKHSRNPMLKVQDLQHPVNTWSMPHKIKNHKNNMHSFTKHILFQSAHSCKLLVECYYFSSFTKVGWVVESLKSIISISIATRY